MKYCNECVEEYEDEELEFCPECNAELEHQHDYELTHSERSGDGYRDHYECECGSSYEQEDDGSDYYYESEMDNLIEDY